MKRPLVRVYLPVRARTIVTGSAAATSASLVTCPLARVSVGVERCRECERYEGRRRVDGQTHVSCCVTSPPPEPPLLRKRLPHPADLVAVGSLLAPEVVCLAQTLSVAEATGVMLARNLSGAPVVDENGRAVGILTRSDVLRAAASASVTEAMMPVLFGLGESDSLARAAALMATENVQHLVVVGDHGRVVGLVTALDATRWLAREAGFDV
jgi:CBS domain-containing protein